MWRAKKERWPLFKVHLSVDLWETDETGDKQPLRLMIGSSN